MEKVPKVTKRVVMNSALLAAVSNWSALTAVRERVSGRSWLRVVMAASVASTPVSALPALETKISVISPGRVRKTCAWSRVQMRVGPLPASSPSGTMPATVTGVGRPMMSMSSSPVLAFSCSARLSLSSTSSSARLANPAGAVSPEPVISPRPRTCTAASDRLEAVLSTGNVSMATATTPSMVSPSTRAAASAATSAENQVTVLTLGADPPPKPNPAGAPSVVVPICSSMPPRLAYTSERTE